MKTINNYRKIQFISDNIALEGYVINTNVLNTQDGDPDSIQYVVYCQNRLCLVKNSVNEEAESEEIPKIVSILVDYCVIPILDK